MRPDIVAEMERRLLNWVDDRLGDRLDPIVEVLEFGLPAVHRLERVIAEDAADAAEAALRDDLAHMDDSVAGGLSSSIAARRTE